MLKTPDITPLQIVALVQAALAVALAFGLPLSTTQETSILALAGVLAAILVGSDASIRRKRAEQVRDISAVKTLEEDSKEDSKTLGV